MLACLVDSCIDEGNVLFNDTLNTFLFTVIWRVGHNMVKNHSDSERGNLLRVDWVVGRKEGSVLFNDALDTFLFTVIWRVEHNMVKDHSDMVREETS